MISLRSYQNNALNSTRQALREGKKAPIIVAPTGAGKTVMASAIIDGSVQKGREVLFLAHRFELIAQAAMKLATFGITHRVIAPVESVRQIKIDQFRKLGRSFVDHAAKVAVGTVQTVSRRLEGSKAPDLIIIDECHLSIAPTYQKIVAQYPDAILLGLTATPTRLDSKGLGSHVGGLYDDLIVLCQPQQLVDDGFLVTPRIYASGHMPDLSQIKTTRGDYDNQQLQVAVDKPTLVGDAVQHYKELAHGRPAVAFCVSVQHAEHMAAEFKAAGYRAVAVSGDTDPGERAAAIEALGTGAIDVVCNCALYIEGLDQPAISCVLLLTPTQSLTRYLQSVGRGLRPHHGKTDCIVLDHAGNSLRHGFPTDDREWTLDGEKRKKSAANDNEPEIKIATCPKCYAIHKPAPECPACHYVYEVKARKIIEQEGQLQEITPEAMAAMRRQTYQQQGGMTAEQMVAKLGYSMGRAKAVVAARERKAAMIKHIQGQLLDHQQNTGDTPFLAFGITLAAVARLKPKELEALQARIDQQRAA